MSARHYGPPPASKANPLENLPEAVHEKPRRGFPRTLAICLACILVVCCTGYLVLFRYVDIFHGAKSPGELAVAWIGALTDAEDDELLRYCVPEARAAGVLADTSGINDTRSLLADYHVTFPNRSIKDTEFLDGDGIEALETGMRDMYNKKIRIKEAARVTVAAEMEWLDGEGVPRNASMEFRVMCVRIHAKWYLYTGAAIDGADVNRVDIPDADAPDEDDVPVIVEPEHPPEPFQREQKPLSGYEGVRTDLESGKVTIEGKDLSIPTAYSEMIGFFTIPADSDVAGMELEPNTVLSRAPFVLVDEEYACIGMEVGIANTGAEAVPVEDGSVTMLYLALPEEDHEAYPEVLLPGNVTFRTREDAALAVYGGLDPYEGGNERVREYDPDAKVYQVTLGGNPHNHLYLHFVDGELQAMQWDCFDFNSYSGDIA